MSRTRILECPFFARKGRLHDAQCRFLVVSLNATACVSVSTARTGDPIALPSGLPSTPCEVTRALEIAPTKVFAQGHDDAGFRDAGIRGSLHVTIVHEQEAEGLGIYRASNRQLVELPVLLPELENEVLEERHMARVQAINEKRDRQADWFLFAAVSGPVLLTAGSIVAAIGLEREDSTAVSLTGVSLIGAGALSTLIGLIAVAVNHPTGQERVYSDVRNRIFLEGEDDLAEVVKSVDAFNRRVRETCAARDD
jgi:hypothetical protein